MENSKLFSNEPLRILKSHIEDLRKLYKKEQEKSTKMKKILKKIQDLWGSGNKIELGRFLDGIFVGKSKLNESFLNGTWQIEGIGGNFVGLGNIVKNRMRKVFETLKELIEGRKIEGVFVLMEVVRRRKREGFKRIVDKMGLLVGLFAFCLKKVVWKRVWISFNAIIETKTKNFTVKIRKIDSKSSASPTLRKFFNKKVENTLKIAFSLLKIPQESLIIFEQGFVVLNTVISSLIFHKKFSIFTNLRQKLKPHISIFHQFGVKTLTFHLKYHQKSLLLHSFSCLSTPKTIKIFHNNTKMSLSLNPIHHHLSKTLLSISKLPSLVKRSLKKSSFLSIVSYVSYHISYDMLEKSSLQRMTEIFKSFSVKKMLRYLNTWKNSGFFEFSAISGISNLFEQKKNDPQKKRSCFINLNLILQRLQSVNKSQAFMAWQEVEARQKVEFKENFGSLKGKGKKRVIVPPLRLNQNVNNLI